ncbi:DNA polymerase Y family protein [Pseudooceanicola sediminis]|uniref:DNA-directed DNA polymerase n=1 Tax=Pseudooceanicola sediminis TaxID=2211117 RepID=A0A399J6E6_9RHOB|nr:DNA polymerase Y family protein [Pseudooceanicola sediminis]KAA2316774.1 DNA polymerase Y family protein [Puniceibacterium sp. HSS470]RII40770.1 DNA polymerase Y family protein [Pseudooceanicola sediminis]|tara:strand:- start:254644 stop:256101 length:1458 start_codon:yes stop_codon:yes gene_type:complete
MFDGLRKRVVCMWFPRLASDRALKTRPVEAPFALTQTEKNAERIYCLNARAEALGLHRGMSFADARAFCPNLLSQPARPELDVRFLAVLRRWATRYCPWVGYEGEDGLVLDVTGSTHLWGGEAAMLEDMRARAERAGLTLRLGVGDTRGAAWALAHHGQTTGALDPLPVAALRLEAEVVRGLQRLGLRSIGDLKATARAPLARRFGPHVLLRLDQATGDVPEAISPGAEPPHYGVRLSFPDPIGLLPDVMSATARLLASLCDKLKAQGAGARTLVLTLRRVDQGSQQVELRLASAMRDAGRILPLFERGLGTVDAGFGIDVMRLEATVVEPLPVQQVGLSAQVQPDQLNDLITRIGTRIGLENVQRFLPADSHIPERSFIVAPAAYSQPENGWRCHRPRPLRLFPPEPIRAKGARPPERFRWRGLSLTTGRATGPERIAPEWWLEEESWRSGLRDYWKVDTLEGLRLWLFYTPQTPGWWVQGEFL